MHTVTYFEVYYVICQFIAHDGLEYGVVGQLYELCDGADGINHYFFDNHPVSFTQKSS